ncbi:Histidine--tRNA ligase [Buchnera aphidicola (Eriosoma lanigerum)]|uniref:histidine--tRNA ligase n=1 Tax=Buchnera aphidicola TaxID=9 RepID=UPI0034640F1C
MNQIFQSIRGMHDFLPNDLFLFNKIQTILQKILNNYCYSEIRMPILEKTELFKKTIGDNTDIIEKEMYSFLDHGGRSITLRPEGTVGCVRACIEHSLLYHKIQRLWYIGPMFRYERPQNGRYRQFYQLGVETFGLDGPESDVELIMIAIRWWKKLGILPYLKLEINSIGSLQSRLVYKKELIQFLDKHKSLLDINSRNKIISNPFRILDDKNQNIQHLLQKAPKLYNYLDEKSSIYFDNLCQLLNKMKIEYYINHFLVRGLDYYNDTVFEWTTTKLGSENTVCAGGRYDLLVQYIGGNLIPAVGLAVGMERLILLFKNIYHNIQQSSSVDINILFSNHILKSIQLSEEIRNIFPKLKIMINYSGGSIKKQLDKAYKSSVKIILFYCPNQKKTSIISMINVKEKNTNYFSKEEVIKNIHHIFNIS